MPAKLIVEEVEWRSPETVAGALRGRPGLALLRSGLFDSAQARYSILAVDPFLKFTSYGTRCECVSDGRSRTLYGNPWQSLESLMSRYELLDEIDLPFPLGGCLGFWGYDLKNFVEPGLPRTALNDLELPDCQLGFHDSLLVFDHRLQKLWIVSTGMQADGSRSAKQTDAARNFWMEVLATEVEIPVERFTGIAAAPAPASTFTREGFMSAVRRAKDYIRSGDIYQVNLAQRLTVPTAISGWSLFERLFAISPAPFSAYFNFGEWEFVSSSPELFFKMSGDAVQTRPIKGTRPRSPDPLRDAQYSYELQTSQKEQAELVMITDLLRNDLGQICEYGSVQVPDLMRLEKFPHVQHLVSTVDGRLRSGMTHTSALARCFPGGSITGAPKIRAMQIIDEIEPVTRGPYTGTHGILGFNRESRLSISIRSAVVTPEITSFHAGAGIVADSDPEMEYEETLAKARGFLETLNYHAPISSPVEHDRPGSHQ
jgi:para-aminobenzoate synthetase component 1